MSALDGALVRWLNDRAMGGILTTDRELIVRSWNGWLARATGQTAETVVGRHLFEVRPELAQRGLDRYFTGALDGQSSLLAHRFHGYLLKIPAAGRDMPQSASIAPLLDGDVVIGTITTIEDVSERVNSEQELRRQIAAAEHARAEAEAALRAKDEFLATLSHELRTPLNAVLGWTNILLSGSADAAMRDRALRVIERNAVSQARLIDDMLDMARIVTGKIRLDLSVVDAAAATSAAIDVVRPTVSAKRISLGVDLGGGSGPKLIQADAARLQQIVWNVLSNAVKFTPPGGRIDVRVSEENELVSIAISDSGKGITPEFLPFVFDRFRQGNSSMSRSEGGLGLGLALVRQLVDLHAGQVSVSSAGVNQGTTFVITFPAMGAEDVPAAAERKPRLNPEALRGERVLVVDDDHDWCEALCTVLRTLGAEVHAAETAADAMALLVDAGLRPMTALLIDVGLPQQDGYALLEQIRGLGGAAARIPAIAVTAYTSLEHRRRAFDAGFTAFSSKPVPPEDIAAAILDVTRTDRPT